MSLSPGQRWGLGVNAYLYFFASAVLAPKSNVADEGIPTDSPTLKQKAEGVIRNLTAGTGQADERVTLVDCFPNTARFPMGIHVRHRAITVMPGNTVRELTYPSGVLASNPWRHVIRSPTRPDRPGAPGPRCGVSPRSTSFHGAPVPGSRPGASFIRFFPAPSPLCPDYNRR